MSRPAELRSLISEVLGVHEEELTLESGMGNPEDWDSFAQISIMVWLIWIMAAGFNMICNMY